jgi:RNA polymerase sigma-70 factor (ECF subfamily)
MADKRADIDITQLVADHHAVVYGYAYRLSGNEADAEDLTQQAFLVAQQKLGQLRSVESVRSWLLAITRNGFLKTCQRRRPVAAVDLQLNIDSIPAESLDGEEIDHEWLQQAIDELPDTFKVVLVMFYFEECSYREIAKQLDLPIGTVMSRLARAKGHLRSKLFDTDPSAAEKQQTSPTG